ncbi:MAG: hypothetical protein EZS28_000925 [Streblomastix strix]|uniref:Tubulin binding cofactor C-like domain-containing protein n=1 Tax=Streblomastix strix TaxID=222440 RepID=A0A5J4X8Z6_9EUKA|nr:MAG: hypothetical protein EZS28_000925 [Streblomastix strix]
MIDRCSKCEFHFIASQTRIKSSDTCVFFAHSYQQPVLEGTKKDLFYAKYFAWHSSIETQIPDEKKSKLNEAYTGAKLKGTEGAPTHWMAVPDDWIEEGKFYLVPGCIEKLTLASSATQEDLPSNESLGFFNHQNRTESQLQKSLSSTRTLSIRGSAQLPSGHSGYRAAVNKT